MTSLYFIPLIFGLGTPEIIIIMLVVLLLFGGKKIPEVKVWKKLKQSLRSPSTLTPTTTQQAKTES